MTKQEARRAAGNKQAIFSRERQPKMSAHVLARRYWSLAESEGLAAAAVAAGQQRTTSLLIF